MSLVIFKCHSLAYTQCTHSFVLLYFTYFLALPPLFCLLLSALLSLQKEQNYHIKNRLQLLTVFSLEAIKRIQGQYAFFFEIHSESII